MFCGLIEEEELVVTYLKWTTRIVLLIGVLVMMQSIVDVRNFPFSAPAWGLSEVPGSFAESSEGFGSGESGFGFSNSEFDTRSGEREFQSRGSGPVRESSFFFHDQLIKLAALLVLTGGAVFLYWRRRGRYRKLVLIAGVLIMGIFLRGYLCPLSAVPNVVEKGFSGYLILFLGGLVVPALLWGRVFCGYVCPVGALQEFLYRRRLRLRVPVGWQRPLQFAKYGVLIYLVIRVLVGGQVLLQDASPFRVLFSWGGPPVVLIGLLAVAVLSLCVYRPFCQYGCPLGAFLGLLAWLGVWKLRIGPECNACGLCRKVCPVGAIAGNPPRIQMRECLLCGWCMQRCPQAAISARAGSAGTTNRVTGNSSSAVKG